jgi:acyl-CoA thioesterase-1
MKKNSLFFIALVVCIALGGCQKREIRNIDSRGKTIVCFGNSLTAGGGAGPGEDYPTRLAGYLGLPVINAGRGGDTSSDALKRLEEVLNKDPLLVIVELGGNDFLLKVPQEITINNVSRIVDKIAESGAMVAIMDISPGVGLTEYKLAFARIAREKSVIFLSRVLYGIMTDSRFKSDYLHPNREGYKLIAERVYRGIISYIKQNEALRKNKKSAKE